VGGSSLLGSLLQGGEEDTNTLRWDVGELSSEEAVLYWGGRTGKAKKNTATTFVISTGGGKGTGKVEEKEKTAFDQKRGNEARVIKLY